MLETGFEGGIETVSGAVGDEWLLTLVERLSEGPNERTNGDEKSKGDEGCRVVTEGRKVDEGPTNGHWVVDGQLIQW